jgi:hypothetical protein
LAGTVMAACVAVAVHATAIRRLRQNAAPSTLNGS